MHTSAPSRAKPTVIGHGQEELGLGALEREQREIGGDDDEGGEEDRPRHLDVVASTSFLGQRGVGSASRLRRIASVTTIAPSTMMPKSIAPSESRLAGMFVRCIRMNTATRAKRDGHPRRSARMRGLPRNRMSTMQTRPMPSMTVWDDLVDGQ